MRPEIQFTPIDLQSWPRGQMFYYFSKMAPTEYSLTVDVDVTRLRTVLKAAGYRFFPAYLWLVTRTLGEQQEFKAAETDGVLGYYNVLTPLYAAFHDDDKTFSLMWTEYDDSFPAFHAAYLADKARWGGHHGVLAKEGQLPPPNAYTVSCLPWVSSRHFAAHSYERKAYYFPSVEAGKLYEWDGKTWMPLSLTCHHAAADGYHVDRFLTALQTAADSFERFL